jgi:hypothetical protein
MALGDREAVFIWRVGMALMAWGGGEGLKSYRVITGKYSYVCAEKAFYLARVYTLCFLNYIHIIS